MLNLEGRKLDKYRIMQQIGYVGLMTTYRVYDSRQNRHRAMKVLAADLMGASVMDSQCFLKEAEHLTRMNHPNLLAVLDHGIEDGIHFWVTELIAGVNLSELLNDRAPLPLSQAANISVQVLDALNYTQHGHSMAF